MDGSSNELLELAACISDDDLPTRRTEKTTTRRERNQQYRIKKHREDAYTTLMRVENLQSLAQIFDKQPRKTICIVNLGFGAVGGATTEQLEAIFAKYTGFERVVMRHGKPYSFVRFRSGDEAQIAYTELHEKPCAELNDKVLFLEFLTHMQFAYLADRASNKIDTSEVLDESKGLYYIADFISEDEEKQIMQHIVDEESQSADKWFQVQERFVKHYGHAFDYHIKHIGDPSMAASLELPSWFHPFIKRIRERLPAYNAQPDQLTIQRYPPGSGIAFHSDSHTAFTDTVVILSMGTPVQMDFRKPAAGCPPTSIDLMPRSLVLMTGEARFGWEHAIRMRRSDLIDGRVRERCERWSITMRTTNRELRCSCPYSALCDTNDVLVRKLRQESG